MAIPLENPERDWERTRPTPSVGRADIERRLGRAVGAWVLLGGGLANLTIAVEDSTVLRIYLRDPAALAKEAALLRRPWRSFRVPRILDVGDDFLLLERVAHGSLEASSSHGEAAGRSLAEIHSKKYATAGFLDADLEVAERFPDFCAALRDHLANEIQGVGGLLDGEGAPAVLEVLDTNLESLRGVVGAPVLLHGDFKASNLHVACTGELLVLDWEFAYAGSALMDVGQLMRWSPPPAFVSAFTGAYAAAGGCLPDDWPRWSALLDLVNLVGLLRGTPPRSRRAADILGRLKETARHCGLSPRPGG